jgi:hypothetical protein
MQKMYQSKGGDTKYVPIEQILYQNARIEKKSAKWHHFCLQQKKNDEFNDE